MHYFSTLCYHSCFGFLLFLLTPFFSSGLPLYCLQIHQVSHETAMHVNASLYTWIKKKKVKNKHKFCQTIYFNFQEKLEHMLLYLAIRYSQRIGAHPEHFSVPGTPGVVYWRIPVAPVYLSDIPESEQRTRTWYWNFIMTIYQNLQ